ncbi:MAG: SagB/ThcOx family dehydrogenase, partial [bacterium]|nr:SagB/ThcOx family dehydrogenase [bacterium]
MKMAMVAVIAMGMVACSYAEEKKAMKVVRFARVEVEKGSGLVQAIGRRRSVRSFEGREIEEWKLGMLLWAAQGVSSPWGYRTAPSAGALYPLETYVATRGGVYQYLPKEHALVQRGTNDVRGLLAREAYGQTFVGEAPVVVVFTAVYERETRKYGERGIMYTHMEVGHAAQNLMLQAVEFGLGTVAVGAFDERGVSAALGLPRGETPVYL